MTAAGRALLLAFSALAALASGYLRFAPSVLADATTRSTVLPYGLRSAATESQLKSGLWQAGEPGARRVAERGIAASPLNGTPLVWLEADYAATDNPSRADRIGEAAEALGWRDPQVQRLAYNRHFEMGEFSSALDRADALLRQNMAKDELYPHMIAMLGDRSYASALAAKLETGVPWADDFTRALLTNGNYDRILDMRTALEDRVILDRFTRKAFDAAMIGGNERLAVELAKGMAAPSGFLPPYATNRKDGQAGPYVWSLGPGMSARSNGTMHASAVSRGQSSSIMLALLPGEYALGGDTRAFDERDWQWSLSCRGQARLIITTQPIVIGEDCLLQTLRLEPLGHDPSDLGPIMLERL